MTEPAPPSVALLEACGRGGLAHFTYALATALAEAGARVSVLTATPYELEAHPRSFELVRVFDRWRTNPVALWRALRRVAPDVVHLHGAAHPELYVPLVLVLRLAGIPTVYSAHDLEPRQRRWFPAWVLRLLFRLPDRLVAHSRSVAERLTRVYGVAPERVHVVPHGSYAFLAQRRPDAADDASPVTPADQVGPTALFFGFILPQKGLDDLIAAFRTVVDAIPQARLVIAGEASGGFEPYRRQIRELDLEDSVECRVGYVPVDAMADCFAACRIVVLPYRSSSQSGVLPAAFGAGRAVVVTDCPGLTEFVRPDRTGLVVPVGDRRALAGAITRLLGDPATCRRMGDEARRWSERELGWSDVAAAMRRVYRSVAPEARPMQGELWKPKSG